MNTPYSYRLKNHNSCFVMVNLLVFRIFLRFPSIFFIEAKSGAFLSALWSGLVAFGIILLLFWLWQKSGGKNLLVLANTAFGKLGKYILTITLCISLFLSAVSVLGDVSSLSKIISFPTAPIAFVVLFFALGAILGALGGARAILQTHGVFVPVIILGLSLLIVSVVSGGDFNKLFPILGSSPQAVFGEGLKGMIVYSDIILLFLIIPEESQKEFPLKKLLFSAGIGIILSVLFILAVNLTVSAKVITADSYPFYLCMKEVYYGRFIQRIDALMQLLSSLSAMLYLALNALVFSSMINKRKSLRTQRIISVAFLLIVSASCLILRTARQDIFQKLLFIFGFGNIVLSLITLLFAKRRTKNEKV